MTTFRINRVYTRSGDSGETGLVGGDRVSKSDLRVACYGELDELNSVLGLLKEELTEKKKELFPVIELLQQELFDLGSEVATAAGCEYPGMWRVGEVNVTALEKLCDRFGDGLPELESFILPGGTKAAGWFHVARCVARRAERSLVLLHQLDIENGVQTNGNIIKYINRLSDLFFIMARYSLQLDSTDAPLWVPAKERGII